MEDEVETVDVQAPTSDAVESSESEQTTGATPAENVINSPTDGKGKAETTAAPADDTDSEGDGSLSDLYSDPEEDDQDAGEDSKNQASIGEYDFTDVKTTNGAAISDHDKNIVTNIGKTLGLNNDQARRLLEQGGALLTQERAAVRKQVLTQWGKEIMSDKELGGENYKYTRANLNRFIKTFGGGPQGELVQVLERTGLGQHPAIVRAFNEVGKAIGEDNRFVSGRAPKRARTKADRLRAMYNNSPEMNFGDVEV